MAENRNIEIVQENPAPEKKHVMQEKFLYFAGSCMLFGVFYTICMYDNVSGAAFPVCVAGGILLSVLFLKKIEIPIKKDSYIYYAGMMLLGISVCLTTNGFFHFFNRIGIILLFCAVMLHQIYDDKRWGFLIYMKRLVIFWVQCIRCVFKPFQHGSAFVKGRKKVQEESEESEEYTEKKVRRRSVLIGVGASILFLLVVLPLLIQSDQVFAGFFHFSFDFDFECIWIFMQISFRFIAGFFLTYMFYAALLKRNLLKYEESAVQKRNSLTGITFTAILTLVYVFYSGIQILYLFLGLESGLPEGVTYSEYARSGFWQLLAVSLINIVTILFCMRIFEENRILKELLLVISVCTCIMTGSAAYRMALYVQAYHLTFLRILVLWFLGVLLLLMLGMMISIYKKKFPLFRYMTTVVACCYIAFSMVRADCVIASYNISHSEVIELEDLYYLMYGLSEDAAPYIANIDESKIAGNYFGGEIEYYFTNLKSEEHSLRKWNLSRQRANEAAETYEQRRKSLVVDSLKEEN